MLINCDLKINVSSLDELNIAARNILQKFPGVKIFTLSGELGAGKTAMVKEVVSVLGISDEVTSPTFSIIHEYGEGQVYHFDLYRLNSPADLTEIGFQEYLSLPALKFIEWPELALPFLDNYVDIFIEHKAENERLLCCREINII